MKLISILVAFLCLSHTLYSQGSSSKDFVVLQSGHKVFGSFKKVDERKHKFVGQNEEKIKIKPKQVKEFQKHGNFYKLFRVRNPNMPGKKDLYLRLLTQGEISLWAWKERNQVVSSPYISFNAGAETFFYVEVLGEILLLHTTEWENQLKELFTGRDDLIKKIEQEDLEKSDILSLIESFNRG